MPDVDQVVTTLPISFHDKYQTTYAIIDATEIFLETPSDLHLQSSTWSSYKSHTTEKILVGCTPNRAITYVSPMYVGSISDVELTHVCGQTRRETWYIGDGRQGLDHQRYGK